jgi:23S rRNA pseudouridine2604 synthase
VFSTDGRVVREITQGGHWAKKYLISCTTDVTEEQIEALNAMRELGQWKLKPMRVSSLGGRRIRFELREGKKHQIREVCHAVGLEVSDLYRVAVGPLELGPMPEGQWRLLSAKEIEEVLSKSSRKKKSAEQAVPKTEFLQTEPIERPSMPKQESGH